MYILSIVLGDHVDEKQRKEYLNLLRGGQVENETIQIEGRLAINSR